MDVCLWNRAKLRIYVQTIAWQWLLVAALWLVLHRHGLSLVEAGEHLGDARLTLSVTAGLAATVGTVFVIARWRIRRSRATPAQPVADHVRAIAPAGGLEMSVFALVCVTAGIGEELLYRGWLVNLLRVATGSVWIAVVIGSTVFGTGHAYQGGRGMLRTGLIGFQLAVLFVYVGSLIPGQVLHAAADLVAGALFATSASRARSARGLLT